MPSRFARQFGYDQLYVGNPNAGLRFNGNLFEGVLVWYYSVAGGTRTVFCLLYRTPNCHTHLSFCTWYFLASRVPGFGINSSCIKSIKASYKAKLESNKRMRGMTEYQEAEKETGREVGMEPRWRSAEQRQQLQSRSLE